MVQIFKLYNGKSPVWGIFLLWLLESHQCNYCVKHKFDIYCATQSTNNHLTLAERSSEQDIVAEAMRCFLI